jgi:hypothetical protein
VTENRYFESWRPRFSVPVDVDGDGRPDSPAQQRAQYSHYRPLFTSQLRAAMGQGAIFIANTLGVVDPALNGLTIEACENVSNCEAAFKKQAEATRAANLAPVGVVWLKGDDPQECAKVKGLRQKLPFLLEGTDFYDGTHVVCPNELP